jgi:hypothetical protein
MASSPGYRQIRQIKLQYDSEVTPMLPDTLSVLDVVALPDPHRGTINTPYLVYIYKGGPEVPTTLRMISGQAELDYTHESFQYLGMVPQKKSSHPNFSTLWKVTKKKSHPDNAPPPPPPEPKKKAVPKLSAEAKEEAKLAAEREAFEARLEESGV